MDARELRIGDWIQTPNGIDTVFEVHCISEPIINGWYAADISPIPLTEEWLTRFGFDKDSEFWYSIHFACYTEMGGDRIYDLSINPEIGKCIVEFVGYHGTPIEDGEGSGFAMSDYLVQHVHTLQNLYFALTGAELEIKDAKDNDR